ncbi:MAG: metallophosphoesterase [Candidatus Paceibacterota bacterium]|jgi:DNA repair exonuclease SbcCD nuclease subunit
MIAFVTDLHLKDKPPESRIDDYAHTVLGKLEKVFQTVDKSEGDQGIICGGDLFDVKEGAKISHGLVVDIIALLRQYSHIPFYTLIGNHDIKYDRLDTIEKQPLGVLLKSGLVHRINKKYLENNSNIIFGLDFIGDKYLNYDMFDLPYSDSKFNIVCVHCNIMPDSETFYYENALSFNKIIDRFPKLNLMIMGHIHFFKENPLIYKYNNSFLVGPGSLARVSSAKENLDRDINIVYIKDKGFSIDKLEVKPSSEIFDLKRIEELKQRDGMIADFVSDLVKASSSSSDSIDEILNRSNIDENIKTRVYYYLKKAQ